jgi:hypothetical protein
MMCVAIGSIGMVKNEECSVQLSDAAMSYLLPRINLRTSCSVLGLHNIVLLTALVLAWYSIWHADHSGRAV